MPTVTKDCSRLRRVACISYPRSGHHLTVRALRQYFADEPSFKYCAYYKQGGANPDCCQCYPCTDPTVTMTKNHDMDLNFPRKIGIPKIEGLPYLILIRNFLEAVVSDYALHLQEADDTRATWLKFSQRKKLFYQRFIEKWVLNSHDIEKLVVNYEVLTADPVATLSQIIDYFRPSQPVDKVRLTKIIETAVIENAKPTGIELVRNFGVRNRRNIEDFKYFEPEYFAELEGELSHELTGMGYPLRYAA